MENSKVKISFGMIVLNGEPFLEYNLRSLYPFAHEIIVVEGATKKAKSISDSGGHSVDQTLSILENFKENHDPENKIQIIKKEGYWEEKDEQSQAYASVASGNYLWQVDVDEFYLADDMKKIIKFLEDNPEIDTISFQQLTFWGRPSYIVDSWYLRMGADIYHRLFKWRSGYKYSTHRPPTVLDENGVDLREKNWINDFKLNNKFLFLYHYSLLFPSQVKQKLEYYSKMPWGDYSRKAVYWGENNFLGKIKKPFQLHNVHTHVGWIEEFKKQHPREVNKMMSDIKNGKLKTDLREMSDVKKLLNNKTYIILRYIVKVYARLIGCKVLPKKRLSKIFYMFSYDFQKDKIYFDKNIK